MRVDESPVRRSEWRPVEDRVPRDTLAMVVGVAASILVVGAAAAFGDRAFGLLGRSVGGAIVPLTAIGCTMALSRWLGGRRERALAEALGDEGNEVAVVASYSLTGRSMAARLGRDEGMLSLVDGWLHFRGLRTEWSLSAGKVRREGTCLGVPTGHPEVSSEVRLSAPSDAGMGDVTSIRDMLDAWQAASLPDGSAVDPPVVPRTPWLVALEPAGSKAWAWTAVAVSLIVATAFVAPEIVWVAAIVAVTGLILLVTRFRQRRLLVRQLAPPGKTGP